MAKFLKTVFLYSFYIKGKIFQNMKYGHSVWSVISIFSIYEFFKFLWVYKWKPKYWIFQKWLFLKNCDISQFWIIFGSAKNRQVTHLYYVLSHFLRESVSERIERIERGAMIQKYFYEEFEMESLKFKETNEEFKGENYVYL